MAAPCGTACSSTWCTASTWWPSNWTTRSRQLRRSLVELRRFAAPTREVLESLTDASEHLITPEPCSHFRSVCDHAVRVTEWTDSLRDLVATRVALAAVPALVTGFYGINVPFPGDGRLSGFTACIVIMAAAVGGLYRLFCRNDWLWRCSAP